MSLMNCLCYQKPWDITLDMKQIPKVINAKDVLIEIKATGICGTDLGLISGLYQANEGVIIGHESTGVIVEVGKEVSDFKIGERIYIDPTYFCGQCFMCLTKRPNHCLQKAHTETGISRDGTYAKYYVTEERFLYRMSSQVSHEGGTLAEPFSCTLTGANQLRLSSDMRALVLGGGPMGVLYTYALSLKGVAGKIVEISEARLRYLPEVLNDSWEACSSINKAKETANHNEFDVVVDTTGILAKQALEILASGGQILLVGLRNNEISINPKELADKSQKLIGTMDSIDTFYSACNIINKGLLPVDKIVTHTFALSDFEKGFDIVGANLKAYRIEKAQGLKVVMHP